MNAREATVKWNCSVDNVRSWCREGAVSGAIKDKGRWKIPDNAKRPIDRRLQREIIWRVLEKKNDPDARIDLTAWGVADEDILDYFSATIPLLVRKNYPDTNTINSLDELSVTEAGFRLIGRYRNGNARDVPRLLTWPANLTGTFTDAFVRDLMFGCIADSASNALNAL